MVALVANRDYGLDSNAGQTQIAYPYGVMNKFGAGSNKYVLLPCLVAGVLLLAWLIHRFIERPVAPAFKRYLRRAIADLE